MLYLKLHLKLQKEDKIIINEILDYQKRDHVIEFQLENMQHIIDLEKETLERFNDEFYFYLNFKTEECTFELKKEQTVFDIIVDYSFFQQTESGIEMSYALETDDQKNTIFINFEK